MPTMFRSFAIVAVGIGMMRKDLRVLASADLATYRGGRGSVEIVVGIHRTS
jgi:hypothetical protein